jgi:uncharacterized protein YndB with AHSA1/START domain
MLKLLFGKQEVLSFERTYPAPIDTVWNALTRPEAVHEWWGPEKTVVTDCEIDVRVGGRIAIVMQATEAMGKYAGTRWPMEGTFIEVERPHRLSYEARSWQDDKQETTTIQHVNEWTLTDVGGSTSLSLTITVSEVGSGAKLAAVGMKYGYKQYLDKLGTHLSP